MCVVVCAYIQAYMAICVCALYMCTELTVWLDFGACAWYMHLELYTVVLPGSDVAVTTSLTFSSTHLNWCNGKWVMKFGDMRQSAFLFYPFSLPSSSHYMQTCWFWLVESIGGAVDPCGGRCVIDTVGIHWCTVAVGGDLICYFSSHDDVIHVRIDPGWGRAEQRVLDTAEVCWCCCRLISRDWSVNKVHHVCSLICHEVNVVPLTLLHQLVCCVLCDQIATTLYRSTKWWV